MASADDQYEFLFEGPFIAGENPGLWTPRELWVRITGQMVPHFAEDRRVEFKQASRLDAENYSTYLSAFSNTPDGGVILFGVDDSGLPTGCSTSNPKVLNSIETCHISLCPLAQPEFKRIPVQINGSEDFIIAVYVPYVHRLVENHKQEAWIRYGDTRHKMSEEEKRDYRSTRQELSFEQEIAPYNFPGDFDSSIIKEYCDAFRERDGRPDWTDSEVLVDRHLITLRDGKIYPHNALVLLAGKDPRKTIPGCRVRIQRFAGSLEGTGSDYNPIRDRFAEGNIVSVLKKASKEISDIIYDVTWLNKEGKFVTTPEYPRLAWMEALVNACVHRSYSFSGTDITIKIFSDRMEVESPGGFVPPVSERNLYFTRAARNPHLMDALRYLGHVRMAREGTRRIRESMKEWGLPDPVFRQEALHGVVVRVTLRNDDTSRKRATDRDVAQFFGVDLWRNLEEHEVKIAAHAFRNHTIQVSEAARLTGRTWQTSKKDLERLTRKGVLIFEPGSYARDPKAHYRLSRSVSAEESDG